MKKFLISSAAIAALLLSVCFAAPSVNSGSSGASIGGSGSIGASGTISRNQILASRDQFLQALKRRIQTNQIPLVIQGFVNAGGLDGIIRATLIAQQQNQGGSQSGSGNGQPGAGNGQSGAGNGQSGAGNGEVGQSEGQGGENGGVVPGAGQTGASRGPPPTPPGGFEGGGGVVGPGASSNDSSQIGSDQLGSFAGSSQGNRTGSSSSSRGTGSSSTGEAGNGECILNRLLSTQQTTNRALQNFINQVKARISAAGNAGGSAGGNLRW